MHSDSKMLCSIQQATRACRKQSSPTALAHGAAISRSFATSRTPFLLPLVTDAPKCPASPCSQLPGGSWDDSSSGMFSLAPAAEIHAAEQMQTQRCCSSEPRSGDGLWDDGYVAFPVHILPGKAKSCSVQGHSDGVGMALAA